MADADSDAAYTEYVAAKLPWLRRVAYLLCQDWHRADDLLQTTITKLYIHWPKTDRIRNLDGYVRTILVNTFLAEQRSPWWKRVVPFQEDLDVPEEETETDLDDALILREALAFLPPRQRAVIVLRYYDDLSVAQAAEALRCSEGTIKSQTSRAIATLRTILEDEGGGEEGEGIGPQRSKRHVSASPLVPAGAAVSNSIVRVGGKQS